MSNFQPPAGNSRKKTGYLEINKKIYPIFQGLNVIGRDLKASVVVRDIKFSKQHAVISVLDASTHFISDFSSSNGTQVRNINLIPYSFYKLNNGETVTFGDVIGIYKFAESKSSAQPELPSNNLSETISSSQFKSHNAPTQIISAENLPADLIHDCSTQVSRTDQTNQLPIDKHNETTQMIVDIHDAPTQIICPRFIPNLQSTDSNIHDAATQPPEQEVVRRDISDETTQIDEQPTQKTNIASRNKLKLPLPSISTKPETQNLEGRSQYYDDIFANDTFQVSLERTCALYDTEVDETLLENTERAKQENDKATKSGSQDPEPITLPKPISRILNCDSDDDIIQGTQEPQQNKLIDDVIKITENINNDDSETDIDDEISVMNARKAQDAGSDTDIEDNVEKYDAIVDSDAETDVDDELIIEAYETVLPNAENKLATTNNETATKQKNSPYIYMDCDDESDKDIDLLAPSSSTQGIENLIDLPNVPAVEPPVSSVDDAPIQLESLDLNCENVNNVGKYLAPTQLVQPINNDKDLENEDAYLSSIQVVHHVQVHEGNEEVFLAPTQIAHHPKVHDANEEVFLAPTQIAHHPKVTDANIEVFLAPTQIAHHPKVHDANEEVFLAATQIAHHPKVHDANEEFFLAATQIAHHPKVHDANEEVFLAATQIAHHPKVTDANEEDFLAATQIAHHPKVTDANIEVFLAPTQLAHHPQVDDANDEIFLAPTQLAHHPQVNDTNEEVYLAPQILEHSQTDEIFLAPTQLLEIDEKLKATIKKEEEDDVIPDAEELTSSSAKIDAHDYIFSAPTQKLLINDSPRSKKNERKSVSFSQDIFMAPTQKFNEFTFSSPLKQKGCSQKETKEKEAEDNDDIFMAPTQVATSDNQNQIVNSSKNVLNDSDLCYADGNLNEAEELTELSENISMRLVLSETAEEIEKHLENQDCKNNPELNISNNNEEKISIKYADYANAGSSAKTQEPETQLEVEFALETQKFYVEEATSRPNNPLANMFNEENTEMTDQPEIANEKSEDVTLKVISKKNSAINIETVRPGLNSSQKKNIMEKIIVVPHVRLQKLSLNKCENKTYDVSSPNTTTRRSRRLQGTDENNSENEQEKIEINKSVVIELESISKQDKKRTSDKKVTKKVGKCLETDSKRTRNSINYKTLDGCGETPTRFGGNKTRGKTKTDSANQNNTDNKADINKNLIIELENLTNSKSKENDKQENEVKKSTRLQRKISPNEPRLSTITETSESKFSNENDSDSNDFTSISKRTRGKRTHDKIEETRETKIVENSDIQKIEDSDDSDGFIVRKIKRKIRKLEYSQQSEIINSNTTQMVTDSTDSTVVDVRPKRSLKIESFSSDENLNQNSNSAGICLNTPKSKRRKYEPLNITTINTSQVSNSIGQSVKHQVVFTMLHGTDLEADVEKLGGSTIDSINSCTVLVTNKISRSLKFLTAIALGKPIAHYNWIKESSKKKYFLDPWDFLLEDPEMEKKFNFSLKESLKKAGEQKLLNNYSIILAVNKNFEVLKEVIETSGGKCVNRVPPKKLNVKTVVVSYEEDKSKYSKYLKQKIPLNVVSAEAIFSGVLQQKLNFDKHLLS